MQATKQTAPASRGQGIAIRLIDKIGLIDDHWQPRVVAEMNDYQFKVVKLKGDFIWHTHADTDETFIVLDGELRIDLRDGRSCCEPAKWRSCPGASSTSPLRPTKSSCC